MLSPQDETTLSASVAESNSSQSLVGRSAVLRILITGRLIWPLGILAVSLLLSLAVIVLVFLDVIVASTALYLLAMLTIVTALGFLLGAERLRSQLLKPLARLEESVAQVCQGEPDAQLPLDDSGVLNPMVRDIDSISEELTDLYEDMDGRINRQTTRLAQTTSSLRILYDVAASINHSDDLDSLLIRYIRVMKEMVRGRTATVRLKNKEGQMQLVACITPDGDVLREHEMLPVSLCRCGRTLSQGDILCDQNARLCSQRNRREMYTPKQVEEIKVPLEYQGDKLGLCTLYVLRSQHPRREDRLELLSAIGSHLGMAVAKQRSDAEARRLSIMDERNHLAHELHDSLAQTLASLRFQVRLLEETLEQDGRVPAALKETGRLRNGLDEAHIELRDLLTSFRSSIGERGMAHSLKKLVERFESETGISTFLQQSCRQPHLSPTEEMQMLRIVQEALANTRKHAQAHTVRVLLRCDTPNKYMLLIEDDGVGFERVTPEGHPGEHIGLSIMEERAKRVGGELRIESEVGEGTRVEFIFKSSVQASHFREDY